MTTFDAIAVTSRPGVQAFHIGGGDCTHSKSLFVKFLFVKKPAEKATGGTAEKATGQMIYSVASKDDIIIGRNWPPS
ncbi:UNVERIFIED_CONTAM: hypothetical protein K2H54_017987 [Gekko kuhli]